MNKEILLRDLYKSQTCYLGGESGAIDRNLINEKVAALFCPGPFYYTILDSPTLIFDRCSDSTLSILGEDLSNKPLESILLRFHPDDMDYVFQCEKKVADFLQGLSNPNDILKYKISYCYRGKVASGEYKLFSLQNLTLAIDGNGSLLKVLGVHTDISYITTVNNYKLSFIGLEGMESYMGLGVETDTKSSFSKRELDVIKLMGEGLTAVSIASKLFISEQTVISHKKNAMERNNCQNSTQLVALAIREGNI